MIRRTNAYALLTKNLQRTEMLIIAMEKVKVYNGIYQASQTNLTDFTGVKSIQDPELDEIEHSCAEHAIISLVTAFETYSKELIQQMLAEYPEYFTSRDSIYSNKIRQLLESLELFTYEDIERELNLRNRFHFFALLEHFAIPFLSPDEKEFVEYLYALRNHYVHNAGRSDPKLAAHEERISAMAKKAGTSTGAKRLRTRFSNILSKSYERINSFLRHSDHYRLP